MIYDPETLKLAAVIPGASIGRYTLDTIDLESGQAVFRDTLYPGSPRHTLQLRVLSAPRTPLKVIASPQPSGAAP